ncbi:uncharacterized protein LOC127249541 isoform X2 [Andrographis paniculata]|uniref:uncharacterized protein LOC127249541 isoform X2 n=1 Tax=Andrographis paniculata TaxID=175694 RepID=UPI0021E8BE02|nr:uncharacterized protein LOC127249541 isoform X2 [Andrographis paniculata]
MVNTRNRVSRTHVSQRSNLLDNEILESRKFVEQDSEIQWSNASWVCGEKLKHYNSFLQKGISIFIWSFVCVWGEDNKSYIGYVEDLFDNRRMEKTALIRWFLHSEDVEGRTILKMQPDPQELFITYNVQEISAKCIDGLVSVLTPSHFKKCNEVFPQHTLLNCFFCHREIKSNSVSKFCMSKLRGYAKQHHVELLTGIYTDEGHDQTEQGDPSAPRGLKKSKINNNFRIQQTRDIEPPQPVRVQERLPAWHVGDHVEVLSFDSGMRGCWLRCKVLRRSPRFLYVQYYDVINSGESQKVECVPREREADPDELGIRISGRLNVRAWPNWNSSNASLSVGTAVDAWCGDGWWEAIVIGCDPCLNNQIQLFFPGEKKFQSVDRKDIRIAKDWVNNYWVDINPVPDILAYLTSLMNPPRLPEPPTAPRSEAAA